MDKYNAPWTRHDQLVRSNIINSKEERIAFCDHDTCSRCAAELMAAAPEMLALLKRIKQHRDNCRIGYGIGKGDFGSDVFWTNFPVEDLEALINKLDYDYDQYHWMKPDEKGDWKFNLDQH